MSLFSEVLRGLASASRNTASSGSKQSASVPRATSQPKFSGYGRCGADCNCKAFEGVSNCCSNCSHSYARHW